MFEKPKRLGQRRVLAAMLASMLLLGGAPVIAHEDHDEAAQESVFQLSKIDQRRDPLQVISSRSIQLTESEQQAGVVSLETIMPALSRINERTKVFTPQQFNYFVRNFHYPFRDRFVVSKQPPPTQVVLHWTANSRPDVPLYTFSAFLRSRRNGQIVERANRYKNVSNYFLTGNLVRPDGAHEAQLVKLTRGELGSWGDIPRVTAYPTSDAWDDNKYDGRGAIGIEIESPNFSVFYRNDSQRDKLHNFLLLVLSERGVLEDFTRLRQSPHWDDMLTLHNYLGKNLSKIDVDKRGGIPQTYQHLDKLLVHFPSLSKGVIQESKKMFTFVSGHGIVAREYNERMFKAKRPRDANYHKIDFTEAHVFVVAMDLLRSDLRYRGIDAGSPYDLAHRFNPYLRPDVSATNLAAKAPELPLFRFLPNGRRERIHGE
ncbi:MAG: hypothetical protein CVV27_00260 [Candidatus Melainabacteria bacterium HGW-Melainabacteria-1]|nr:MAG: hypothetical protein CVV27_00260 [Candidatus Melainabacteria bacterium HGW-Melainabacteria-1]